jgi:glycerol kinase
VKNREYVLAIDQGTTGTKVVVFDHRGSIVGEANREIKQYYPNPGWVEHDPREYWNTTMGSIGDVMRGAHIQARQIAAIGITCQRETTILWDKDTGEPVHNAIVWQCRRTAEICDRLKAQGHEEVIRRKTGLLIDAYFSATKIMWLQENVPGVREKIAQGRLLFGTIDTWLIWKLSGGKYHVTDFSNASRTLLLNIHEQKWDDELLQITGVPRGILPELRPSSGEMARTSPEVFWGEAVPIAGDAGDQHAATFGQACFKPGMAKNSYGTALALFMNIGDRPIYSKNGLTTNLAWQVKGVTEYALEGVVFCGGAAVQWLRDGLKIIDDPAKVNELSSTVDDNGGVYMVPAFTGMSAPYWDMYARGLIIGITRGTTQGHIARSALESIAYQTRDVMDAMEADRGRPPECLRVDGGATKNDFLMQFQADILGYPVERPRITEMASLGAAYLAGLGVGFWDSKEEVAAQWQLEAVFEPKISVDQRDSLYDWWKKAVARSLRWAT